MVAGLEDDPRPVQGLRAGGDGPHRRPRRSCCRRRCGAHAAASKARQAPRARRDEQRARPRSSPTCRRCANRRFRDARDRGVAGVCRGAGGHAQGRRREARDASCGRVLARPDVQKKFRIAGDAGDAASARRNSPRSCASRTSAGCPRSRPRARRSMRSRRPGAPASARARGSRSAARLGARELGEHPSPVDFEASMEVGNGRVDHLGANRAQARERSGVVALRVPAEATTSATRIAASRRFGAVVTRARRAPRPATRTRPAARACRRSSRRD